MVFISARGERAEVTAEAGMTLLEIARANGIDLEGACDGALACATCHVIVDPDWAGKLPPPRDDETDMLNLGIGITATSRLGCQIELTEALDGLTVRLPEAVRNLMLND